MLSVVLRGLWGWIAFEIKTFQGDTFSNEKKHRQALMVCMAFYFSLLASSESCRNYILELCQICWKRGSYLCGLEVSSILQSPKDHKYHSKRKIDRLSVFVQFSAQEMFGSINKKYKLIHCFKQVVKWKSMRRVSNNDKNLINGVKYCNQYWLVQWIIANTSRNIRA